MVAGSSVTAATNDDSAVSTYASGKTAELTGLISLITSLCIITDSFSRGLH